MSFGAFFGEFSAALFGWEKVQTRCLWIYFPLTQNCFARPFTLPFQFLSCIYIRRPSGGETMLIGYGFLHKSEAKKTNLDNVFIIRYLQTSDDIE